MPSPVRSVFCPAGQWTQVEWYIGTIWLSKRYIANRNVKIKWRWFSAGIPPYWQGEFVGNAWITLMGSFYLSLEFNPEQSVTITFSTG